ncbi:hypothetical protein F5Y18DRAFT_422402 [Xylariaceae sp. FL1019]|nr:hypothetical protein F5Y18DRAFT_422402 [Xylariaceae sp. FL1019]
MNKNWNDRADKDLFFTILSVKNIGVISGAEWTTIGNHMRSLGYGFTNEGCRQHFQGLRRAQHKAESSNGVSPDGQRKSDPTANPITRRPGPGRGRPRKQPPATLDNPDPVQTSDTMGPTSETEISALDPPTSLPIQTPITESDLMDMDPASVNLEEQSLKRQHLGMDGNQQETNEDEAVLALAADGISGAVDAFGANDSYYGEA